MLDAIRENGAEATEYIIKKVKNNTKPPFYHLEFHVENEFFFDYQWF